MKLAPKPGMGSNISFYTGMDLVGGIPVQNVDCNKLRERPLVGR